MKVITYTSMFQQLKHAESVQVNKKIKTKMMISKEEKGEPWMISKEEKGETPPLQPTKAVIMKYLESSFRSAVTIQVSSPHRDMRYTAPDCAVHPSHEENTDHLRKKTTEDGR